MKKIAILTLTPSNNYGGLLQTIALYNYLEMQGHEVTLINKKFTINPRLKEILYSFLERLPFQNIKNVRYGYLKSKALKGELNKLVARKTQKVCTTNEFKEIIKREKYDVVIVGSDQVWRYKYINDGSYETYFLDFKRYHDIKKVAYAASFGGDSWDGPSETENVARMLEDFDLISVREEAGKKICSDLFNVNATHVLDPTLLLKEEKYKELFDINQEQEEDTLCCYILDNNKIKFDLIREIANEMSLSIVALNNLNKSGEYFTLKDWLSNFLNAKFIITDSFHGMVFSIIFKKQFIVIGNEKRGLARFQSLLNKLGLQERLISLSNIEKYQKILKSNIDYDDVNKILDKEIEFSVSFLNKATGVLK
ncbi:polysaccharide pyruvyl transferase family protein [Pseudoalteromonas lipolytica]|uniref:polysaccharide pyruvyl transferase family protein n=1 Tax=Pseudoalteromonas lipolytica TaxID=570156 RepID=UPI003A96CC7C